MKKTRVAYLDNATFINIGVMRPMYANVNATRALTNVSWPNDCYLYFITTNPEDNLSWATGVTPLPDLTTPFSLMKAGDQSFFTVRGFSPLAVHTLLNALRWLRDNGGISYQELDITL